MASLIKRKNGYYELQYLDGDEKRQGIYLGKIPKRTAEAYKLRIEDLIAASFGGVASDETGRWLQTVGLSMRKKLWKKQLIKDNDLQQEVDEAAKEANVVRLKAFVEDYQNSRTDLKPNSILKFVAAKNHLYDHFGKEKPIADFTEGDAEGFRIYLLGKGQAENTVRKHCKIARQFFEKAVKSGLIPSNPFKGLKVSTIANLDRFYFLKATDAKKLLESLPTLDWKLIFALCRWGGLRCPTEVMALRWIDIDWEENRIRIRSSKTERHGKASRHIPLFPELKPLLDEAFDEASKDGAEYVIRQRVSNSQNLRTNFSRYVENAGLEVWPKLFQNLRSTRETELAQRFPLHVVCRWMGNTEAVAAKHYLQLTDGHFDEALKPEEAAMLEAVENETPELEEAVATVESETQHRTQQSVSEMDRNDRTQHKHSNQETLYFSAFPIMSDSQIPPRGVEPLFPP